MPEFPGFPSNSFDFHFEEAGGALAGLLMRDSSGHVIPGVIPSSPSIVRAGSGWTVRVDPFVAARSKGRSVLLGGSTEMVVVDVSPASSANPRIDVIYSLPADVGAGDPIEAVSVRTGTPGPVPSKPVIPAGAIELATLRTQPGNSSAANGVLVETFPYTTTSGGVVLARTKGALDTVDAVVGTPGYVTATGKSYIKRGLIWDAQESASLTGKITMSLNINQNKSQRVSLPAGLFDSPPLVFATKQGDHLANHMLYVNNVTTSGFDIGLYYGGNAPAGVLDIVWQAVRA